MSVPGLLAGGGLAMSLLVAMSRVVIRAGIPLRRRSGRVGSTRGGAVRQCDGGHRDDGVAAFQTAQHSQRAERNVDPLAPRALQAERHAGARGQVGDVDRQRVDAGAKSGRVVQETGSVGPDLERADLGQADPCLDRRGGTEEQEQDDEAAPDPHPDPSWTSRITGIGVRAEAHAAGDARTAPVR
jgi:hypothetical protein